MAETNTFKEFGELVVTARNAGIVTLKKYLRGERLKKPPPDAEALYALIDSLNDSQKSLLEEGFPYLLDVSFFKLLFLLETSDDPIRIEMNAIGTDGESVQLINNDKDLELRSKYFDWTKELSSDSGEE